VCCSFLKIMDEISEGLRYVLQTDSPYTLMVSGTGHAGMEAAIANLLEPGEKIIVGNAGIWGERVADLSKRYGGEVIELKCPTGETFSTQELTAALEKHKPAVLFLCQGESSTGTHQSLAGLGEVCKRTGTLLLVDTVCSLGGVPLFADAWGIDCIYSGSQKCMSGPPGAAPYFMSQRAMDKLQSRATKPATFNLDMNLIGDYWGWFGKRSYHHTGPVSTFYAMREALAVMAEEGLEPMWARHQEMHEALWDGLSGLGLQPFVKDPKHR
jgi:alanine-glyoxylate transaminase/serine-glyoxylate transaminase/serine-pyruvate transaminase